MDTLAKRHNDSHFECGNPSKTIQKVYICVCEGINSLSEKVMVLFSFVVEEP